MDLLMLGLARAGAIAAIKQAQPEIEIVAAAIRAAYAGEIHLDKEVGIVAWSQSLSSRYEA